MKCCYCQAPLDSRHAANCIYSLGKAKDNPPVVQHGECNKELKFTAGLGPVKVDPNSDAERARIVREALRATGDYHLGIAAGLAPDAALCHLRRLLK
jgi:hypothetical protein